MRQKTMQMELPLEDRGEAPKVRRSGEARPAAQGNERSGNDGLVELMEQVVERGNLQAALKRVRKNKGSPGIDGMRVDELPAFLRENWERIRAELLAGSYRPTAVRRQEIPKSGGGVRQLGIPTVLDRFIQQAILQVLQPIFDPTFSASTATASGRGAGARCGLSGAALRPVGPQVGGGRGSGEVLRPRQPRRADVASGEADRGQAAAQGDPPLPGGRCHGRRGGGGAARGHAAGRAALAAAGERAPGRGGPGAGAERARVRALRR